MIVKATLGLNVCIRSMGKNIRVVAIADNDDEANKFMERNRDTGVIACFGPLVFIAELNDRGQSEP